MKFIISVDTEADNQWERSDKVTLENIKYLPRFQDLCNSYGFKPTYLTSYEMAEAPSFRETLGPSCESGTAEIGAHLHPWTNPPIVAVTADDMLYHPYPHELSAALFKAKMESLSEVIEKAFKRKPRTYRGGRWGFAPEHIPVLEELGYIADCSVTPGISWERHPGDPKRKGGQDYRRAPDKPYFLDPADICKPGNSNLLEIPPTIVFNKMRRAKSIYLSMDKTFLGRWLLAKFDLGPKQFRTIPPNNAGLLIGICNTARKIDLPYVQLMVHSSELMPGGSPFNPDEKSIESLYTQLNKLFEYLSLEQVQGITMSDFATSYITSRK
jgi:hypothetical protein